MIPEGNTVALPLTFIPYQSCMLSQDYLRDIARRLPHHESDRSVPSTSINKYGRLTVSFPLLSPSQKKYDQSEEPNHPSIPDEKRIFDRVVLVAHGQESFLYPSQFEQASRS